MHTEKRLCQRYAGTAFLLQRPGEFLLTGGMHGITEFALLFVFCFTENLSLAVLRPREPQHLPPPQLHTVPALGAGAV